jgi:hypothetical protein
MMTTKKMDWPVMDFGDPEPTPEEVEDWRRDRMRDLFSDFGLHSGYCPACVECGVMRDGMVPACSNGCCYVWALQGLVALTETCGRSARITERDGASLGVRST